MEARAVASGWSTVSFVTRAAACRSSWSFSQRPRRTLYEVRLHERVGLEAGGEPVEELDVGTELDLVADRHEVHLALAAVEILAGLVQAGDESIVGIDAVLLVLAGRSSSPRHCSRRAWPPP